MDLFTVAQRVFIGIDVEWIRAPRLDLFAIDQAVVVGITVVGVGLGLPFFKVVETVAIRVFEGECRRRRSSP